MSGSGYNYEAIAKEKGQQLFNTIASNRSETQVEEENTVVDQEVATYTYSASYKAPSATKDNSILYL